MRTVSLEDEDLRRFCSLPGLSELDPGLVRQHAPDAMLLDEEGGAPVARASLWWRTTPAYGDERVGLIGHYAAVNLQDASRLLKAACARLVEAGCTVAIGPMDGSTWRRYRLLSQRGTEPTFFLEPDNPDDWPAHFTASGFGALAWYYSALCDDVASLPGAQQAPPSVEDGLRLRYIEIGRIDEELRVLWMLASDAFADNFLYTPIAQDEFGAMYRALLPVLRPELVVIAEQDGQPVGFSLAVPDVVRAKRGRPVDTAVFKTLGVASQVKRRGVGKRIFDHTLRTAGALGYRRVIFALIHSDNPSGRLVRPVGREIRRYTLYSRAL